MALENHWKNFESPDRSIIHLQILWWEFPPEHWEELCEGCPMSFLSEPTKGVTPNAPMMEEQINIAMEFINELWSIRVFKLIPVGQEMKGNAPLFTVPNPWQPRQCCCIADMNHGGQNQHIGKDPVHLLQATCILEKLYTGGWSGVLDACKFFHNFPTHPKDHPYLVGCIHPKLGQCLWYLGLPMRFSNSPALSCWYGLGMLCLLMEHEPAFQGWLQETGWCSWLEMGQHDPRLGSGLVQIGDDGLLAALIWVFVDDFKLHAPTKQKLIRHPRMHLCHFIRKSVFFSSLCFFS